MKVSLVRTTVFLWVFVLSFLFAITFADMGINRSYPAGKDVSTIERWLLSSATGDAISFEMVSPTNFIVRCDGELTESTELDEAIIGTQFKYELSAHCAKLNFEKGAPMVRASDAFDAKDPEQFAYYSLYLLIWMIVNLYVGFRLFK